MSANPVSDELALIEKWIETRKSTSQLRTQWLAEKEALQQEEVFLDAEIESLGEQLDGLKRFKKTLIDQSENASRNRQELEEQIANIETSLARYREQLQLLLPGLPPLLAGRIEALLSQSSDSKAGLGARSQRIISALSQIHEFARKPTYIVEVHQDEDGNQRQMETLYWGIDVAYGATASGSAAIIGYRKDGAWTWSDASEHTPTIRHLIDAYNGTVPPLYISVPTLP